MRIGGTYRPNALAGKYLVSNGFFLPTTRTRSRRCCSRRTAAPGWSGGQGHAGALPQRPGADAASSRNSRRAQVNQLLGLVYALLGLAVVIAAIKIREHAHAVRVRAHP